MRSKGRVRAAAAPKGLGVLRCGEARDLLETEQKKGAVDVTQGSLGRELRKADILRREVCEVYDENHSRLGILQLGCWGTSVRGSILVGCRSRAIGSLASLRRP